MSPEFPSLEVHIPLSPTPYFMRMTEYLVRSLRHFGGPYANTTVVLTIGEGIERGFNRHYRWLDAQSVEVRTVPRERFDVHSYYATALHRFTYNFKSDMVLMLDADILIARPFTDAVQRCHREQVFGGVIAHVCPFENTYEWQRFYDALGLGPLETPYEHTGWGYMQTEPQRRFCPPYYNLGALFMPAKYATAIGAEVYDILEIGNRIEEGWARCQITVALALKRLGIPCVALPMRFNFANDMTLEALYPLEQLYASILHILREHQGVYKTALYEDEEGVNRILARQDLKGINAQIQEVLRAVGAPARR